MGCESSTAAIPVPETKPTLSSANTEDFNLVLEQIKQTWPEIQKISNLSAKVFAQ